MSQDNLDNKIKNLFSDMEEQDGNESMSRQDKIWNSLELNKKEKKDGSKLWLLLLLCSLFFAAGWFLRNLNTPSHPAPIKEENKIEPKKLQLQLDLERAQAILIENKTQIDSLLAMNNALSADIANRIDNNDNSKAAPLIQNVYVRDTVYLTEIKIEDRIVERIIRDTILIEVPIPNEIGEQIAEASQADMKKQLNKKQGSAKSKEKRSSVQFNFGETKQ